MRIRFFWLFVMGSDTLNPMPYLGRNKNHNKRTQMKVKIDNTEAEINEEDLINAIKGNLDSNVETAVDYAIDNLDLSYQIEDVIRDWDFSYQVETEIENNSTLVDFFDRVESLEKSLESLALALPNNALAKAQQEKEALQTKFDDLQKKFQVLAGLEEASENEES